MAFPKMLPFCLITPHQSRERQQRQRLRSNLLNPCLETLTAGTLPWGTPPPLSTAMPSHAPRALLLRIWRAVFPAVIGNIPQTPADMLSHLWIPIPRSPVVKSCLHPTAQIGRPVSLNDASGLTILTVSPPGSVSIRQDFFWKRVAFHPLLMLSQGCPAVGFPTRISIRNSFEDGESLLSYHLALLARASSHRHSPVVKSCLQSASAFRCRNRPPHSKVVTRRLLL